MKRILLATLLVAGILLLIRPIRLALRFYVSDCPATGPITETDFSIYSESVNLDEYRESLLSYRDIAEVRVADTIQYGGSTYEVHQIDVVNDWAEKQLLIFATIHGNEFVTALVVLDLLDDIRRSPEFYRAWNIRVMSPMNPVGLAHNSRYNENGCDINRDFKTFATQGAQLQRKMMEEFQPQAVIALHEGPQEGFFVIAERPSPDGLREAITRDLKKNNVTLAKRNFLGIPIGDSGMWYKPTSIYGIQKVMRIHTLGRFTHEKGVVAFTTESPWSHKDIESRRRPHLLVVRTIVEHLTE